MAVRLPIPGYWEVIMVVVVDIRIPLKTFLLFLAKKFQFRLELEAAPENIKTLMVKTVVLHLLMEYAVHLEVRVVQISQLILSELELAVQEEVLLDM